MFDPQDSSLVSTYESYPFSSPTHSPDEVHYIGREELRRLNDAVFVDSFHEAVRLVIQECLEAEPEHNDSEPLPENESEYGEIGDGEGGGGGGGVKAFARCNQGMDTGSSLANVAHTMEEKAKGVTDGADEDSCSEGEDMADCIVLDLTAGFSLFGLMAVNEGASFVQVASTHCVYDDLLIMLARQNNVGQRVSVRQLDWSSLLDQFDWDMVVCDVVSPQGTLHSDTVLTLQALW